jgi:osomolarity two-component system sensor histidine kinase SLN1
LRAAKTSVSSTIYLPFLLFLSWIAEFKALEGSLSMMSKVLNDVLDFNRMDSGRFESVSKPFAFHMVMRSLFVPLRMATDARKLEFTTELDPAIDKLTRAAMYQALGESPAGVARRLAEADDADESGMVVGDEMRLRQIINNLASNACKFTPAGGRITIRTKLIWPTRLPEPLGGTVVPDANTPASDMTTPRANAYGATPHPGVQRNPLSEPNTPTVAKAERPPIAARSSSGAGSSATGTTTDTEAADAAALHDVLSANHLDQHNQRNTRPLGIEKIVVRIEVTDTGCGITSSDMVKNKLFSAFNQTEQGRQQGGKGTGLGLALVRQIVKRTGGRLGVSSAGSGQGSTFWVEMPLGCGSKAVVGGADRLHRLAKMDTPDEIDAALTEFTPAPPLAARKGPRRSSDLGPLAPAALENLMDQQGQMASLPSMTMESANPILSRMAIKETGGSPAPDAVSLNLMHPDDGAEPEPHGGMGASLVRDPPPPPIVLPPTSPALVLASARPANVSTPPPATPPSATITRTPAPPAPPFAQMPVLVVDDDSLTRMLMKRLLTRLGCKVTTAENGEAALAALTGSPRPTPQSEEAPPTPVRANTDEGGTAEGYVPEGTYAVVFLDNQMPVLSGLEAVRRLRQAGRSDFVVGVTGNALLSDQEDYLEAGADYVLTKPVLEKSLRGMLVLADEMRQQRPRRESKT